MRAIIANRERAKACLCLTSKKKGRVHQATNYVEPGPARRHKPINLFPNEVLVMPLRENKWRFQNT